MQISEHSLKFKFLIDLIIDKYIPFLRNFKKPYENTFKKKRYLLYINNLINFIYCKPVAFIFVFYVKINNILAFSLIFLIF